MMQRSRLYIIHPSYRKSYSATSCTFSFFPYQCLLCNYLRTKMGSLMAGWSSRVLDHPETVLQKRNKSMTKEEIESYRKLYKLGKEEEDEEEPEFQATENSESIVTSPRMKKSSGSQELQEVKNLSQAADQADNELIINTGDWWTRSNWAFLNEPPRDEVGGSAQKYAAQFHVAQLATGQQ